jgi:glycosyltransferase involved in cell wall biosynthesis
MVMRTEGIPAGKIDVVYNGVDTAVFAQCEKREEVRSELHIPPDSTVVGIVGRLSEEKGGVDVLIRAIARLRKINPNLRLLVVGDGPLRGNLEALADESAPGGAIMFTGTRNDVAHLLSAMDLFVLPSLNEALPIVVLEAMAAGLPVIATNVGGVPEIVEHEKTGLLVAPGSEDALYSALNRLTYDAYLRERLAQAGRRRVTSDFTIERMVERIEGLYGKLLTKLPVAGCQLSADRRPATASPSTDN